MRRGEDAGKGTGFRARYGQGFSSFGVERDRGPNAGATMVALLWDKDKGLNVVFLALRPAN
jgi:hypothetical protein